ncbi:MAG: tetratricopeptide repeat protein [Magnetococcales bacterium]|nr:tetratricopeptide repeat protein [Magnetococcales bacterium]
MKKPIEKQSQLTVDAAYSQAIEHFNSGRFEDSDKLCTAIIAANPQHVDALNLLGVVAQKVNRHDLAVIQFQRAIKITDNSAILHYNLGISLQQLGQRDGAIKALQTALEKEPLNQQIRDLLNTVINTPNQNSGGDKDVKVREFLLQGESLHKAGQLEESIHFYKKALEIHPENFIAWSNMGVVLTEAGKLDEAVASHERSIAIRSDLPQHFFNLGTTLMVQGKNDKAIENLKKAVAIKADFAEAHYNIAALLIAEERFAEGVASYQSAVAIKADYVEAHYNLGNALNEYGKPDEAIASYQKALAINPDIAEAHNNIGNILKEQGELAGAVASYKRAININPDFAIAHSNLGKTLADLGRLDAAIISLEKAISIEPDLAEAHNNLGLELTAQGKLDRAITALEKAISIKPGFASAYSNLGNALADQGRLDEAVVNYTKAIAIDPEFAKAYHNYGNALIFQGRPDQAVVKYQKAISLKPDLVDAHSNLLLAMHYNDFSQEDLFNQHKIWAVAHSNHLPRFDHPVVEEHGFDKKLKIGFVSGDFRDHSVAYFLQPLFTAHNREKLEFFCYSTSNQEDGVTAKLRSLVAMWRNVAGENDQELAKTIYSDRIDILVDLSGHTKANRLLVFARKPAPIQVTWLGYPNGTGMAAMDYRFTDKVADPPGLSDGNSVEKLYRLADGFLCYQPVDVVHNVSALPMQSQGYVTFVTFNNLAKITKKAVKSWAAILKRVPGSKLIIKSHLLGGSSHRQYYLSLFAKELITSQRLLLMDRCDSKDEHLSLYGQCDIGLDTFPYNGVTTTCEALWMGVPVVVLRGSCHVARVGASLLTQIGLEDLIADDLDDYIKKAVALAKDPSRLENLRIGMRSRIEKSSLHDAGKFAGNMEQAFHDMWSERCSIVEKTDIEEVFKKAVTHHKASRFDAAIEGYKKALTLSPGHVAVLGNLGYALINKGRMDEAVTYLQKAVTINPNFSAAYNYLGIAYTKQGELGKAITCYQRAVEINPDNPGFLNNLGNVLYADGELDGAEECYAKAINIKPGYAEPYSNLGNVMTQRGQLDSAVEYYNIALKIDPGFSDACSNLGAVLSDQEKFDEAVKWLKKALQINPEFADALRNLGTALSKQGKISEAVAAYKKALIINPDNQDAHYNLGINMLLMGDLENGWREYEWRKQSIDANLQQPVWDGSMLNGETVLLLCEQGFGDDIQFIRYAEVVKERGAKVVLLAPKPLEALFKTVSHVGSLISDPAKLPSFDYQVSLLSLPFIFATTLATIPAEVPYLHADPVREIKFSEQLRVLTGLKIGIAWRGSPTHKNDQNRSIKPSMLAQLLSVEGCSFVGLQNDTTDDELKMLSGNGNFFDISGNLDCFADTAAVISGLDLVISVDTSVAHLAGALGRATWLMLPVVPDWRWLLEQETTPWYPTLRLFRQSAPKNWQTVVEKITKELSLLVTSKRSQTENIDGAAFQRGVAFHQAGRLYEALDCYKKALEVDPENWVAHSNIGLALQSIGELDAAVASHKKAIAVNPDYADAYNNLGNAQHEQGNFDAAVASFQRAIAINPGFDDAHSNLGNILKNQGKLVAAVDSYQKAITINPNHAAAYNNLGIVKQELGALDLAVTNFQKAITINADYADAHYNLGNARKEQGELALAVDSYQKAIAINPGYANAHNNLGIALAEQGELDLAVVSYQKAIALVGDFTEAYYNLGNTLHEQQKLDLAVKSYQKALAIMPDYAQAHCNLGSTFKDQGRLDAAQTSYLKAFQIKANDVSYLAEAIHLNLHLCQWGQFPEQYSQMMELFKAGDGVVSPFVFLSLPTTAKEQRDCAESFVRNMVKRQTKRMDLSGYDYRPSRLKIGYLSCDFYNHATYHLIAELFELHDRSRFEIIVYSYGRTDGQEMRQRIVAASDRFVDISQLDNHSAARKISSDKVAILVDLKGHTQGSRHEIFSYRPAPLQVNWLGYPGTVGSTFIDYIISDPFITPVGYESHFSEKIVRLADCYQPNDRTRPISSQTPSRSECSLPEDGYIFASFNQTYKIMPDIFDIWMELLRSMPNSSLWLLESNRWAVANLRKEAESRQVDGSRIIFAAKLPMPDHLARYRLVDLALDTYPYTSHTTASDALWAGCPLVTYAGESFASRVAGSILSSAGLSELITSSLEEYRALIFELAENPERLKSIRNNLQKSLSTSPLFDSPRFTKNLEAAYESIWMDSFFHKL